MGTAVLWGIFCMVGAAKLRFCQVKAEWLNIKVKQLISVKSEPLDFLYDFFMGIMVLTIILIQTQFTISSFLAIVILGLTIIDFLYNIKRLSKEEAD